MDISLRDQFNSPEDFIENLKSMVVAFIVIGFTLLFLWLWYWHGQREAFRVCMNVCDQWYPFGFDGLLGYLEEGFSQNVSHAYHNHLYNNMMGFAVAAFFVIYFQPNRIAIIQLYVTFTILVYTLPVLTDAMGFSAMLYGTIGLASLSLSSRGKAAIENWRSNKFELLMLAIVTIIMFYLLSPVIQEALVLLGYTTPREFGIGDPGSDLPPLFTVQSIQGHISGFVTGIFVWILSHLVLRRVGQDELLFSL